ncbi:hypothetical protein CRUP_037994 [Coryphaenoides rupestris]|nr:hypothetical protein CRUP_037994 [Coryphaenoides rupestris]
MEPSTHDVIHIDESDSEVSPQKVRAAATIGHMENPTPLEPVPPSTQGAAAHADNSALLEPPSTQGAKEVPAVPCAPKSEPTEVPEQEMLTLGSFQNHTGPVHSLQVYGGRLYTCSGDGTARAYCLVSKECQAVFEGHSSNVNCLLVAPASANAMARLYTGSSDKTVRCFSIKGTQQQAALGVAHADAAVVGAHQQNAPCALLRRAQAADPPRPVALHHILLLQALMGGRRERREAEMRMPLFEVLQ